MSCSKLRESVFTKYKTSLEGEVNFKIWLESCARIFLYLAWKLCKNFLVFYLEFKNRLFNLVNVTIRRDYCPRQSLTSNTLSWTSFYNYLAQISNLQGKVLRVEWDLNPCSGRTTTTLPIWAWREKIIHLATLLVQQYFTKEEAMFVTRIILHGQ